MVDLSVCDIEHVDQIVVGSRSEQECREIDEGRIEWYMLEGDEMNIGS